MAFTSITTLSGVTTIKVTSVNDVSGITLERSGNGYIVKYADTILNKPSTDSTIAGSTTKVKVVVGVGNLESLEKEFSLGLNVGQIQLDPTTVNTATVKTVWGSLLKDQYHYAWINGTPGDDTYDFTDVNSPNSVTEATRKLMTDNKRGIWVDLANGEDTIVGSPFGDSFSITGTGVKKIDGGANEGTTPQGNVARDSVDVYIKLDPAFYNSTAVIEAMVATISVVAADATDPKATGYTHVLMLDKTVLAYLKNVEQVNIQIWRDFNKDSRVQWDADPAKNESTWAKNIQLAVNVGEIRLKKDADGKDTNQTDWGILLKDAWHYAWINGTLGADTIKADDLVSDRTKKLMLDNSRGLWIDAGAGNDTITGTPYSDNILGGDGNDKVDGGTQIAPATDKGRDVFEIRLTAADQTTAQALLSKIKVLPVEPSENASYTWKVERLNDAGTVVETDYLINIEAVSINVNQTGTNKWLAGRWQTIALDVNEIRVKKDADGKDTDLTDRGTKLTDQMHFVWVNGNSPTESFDYATVSAATQALMVKYERGLWVNMGGGNDKIVGSPYGDNFNIFAANFKISGLGTRFIDGGENKGKTPWGNNATDNIDVFVEDKAQAAKISVSALSETPTKGSEEETAKKDGYTGKILSDGKVLAYIKGIEFINIQVWNDVNGDGQLQWDQDVTKNEITWVSNIRLSIDVSEIRVKKDTEQTEWNTPLADSYHMAWIRGTEGADSIAVKTLVSQATQALQLRYSRGVNIESGSGNDTIVGSDYSDNILGGAGDDLVDGGSQIAPTGQRGQDVFEVRLQAANTADANAMLSRIKVVPTTENEKAGYQWKVEQRDANGNIVEVDYLTNIEAVNINISTPSNQWLAGRWQTIALNVGEMKLDKTDPTKTVWNTYVKDQMHFAWVNGTASDEFFDYTGTTLPGAETVSAETKTLMALWQRGVSVDLGSGNDQIVGSPYGDNFEISGSGTRFIDGGTQLGTRPNGGSASDNLNVYVGTKELAAGVTVVPVDSKAVAGTKEAVAFASKFTSKIMSGNTVLAYIKNIEWVNVQIWNDINTDGQRQWDSNATKNEVTFYGDFRLAVDVNEMRPKKDAQGNDTDQTEWGSKVADQYHFAWINGTESDEVIDAKSLALVSSSLLALQATHKRGLFVNGNAGKDTITGSDYSDNIQGGAGDDLIDGGTQIARENQRGQDVFEVRLTATDVNQANTLLSRVSVLPSDKDGYQWMVVQKNADGSVSETDHLKNIESVNISVNNAQNKWLAGKWINTAITVGEVRVNPNNPLLTDNGIKFANQFHFAWATGTSLGGEKFDYTGTLAGAETVTKATKDLMVKYQRGLWVDLLGGSDTAVGSPYGDNFNIVASDSGIEYLDGGDNFGTSPSGQNAKDYLDIFVASEAEGKTISVVKLPATSTNSTDSDAIVKLYTHKVLKGTATIAYIKNIERVSINQWTDTNSDGQRQWGSEVKYLSGSDLAPSIGYNITGDATKNPVWVNGTNSSDTINVPALLATLPTSTDPKLNWAGTKLEISINALNSVNATIIGSANSENFDVGSGVTYVDGGGNTYNRTWANNTSTNPADTVRLFVPSEAEARSIKVIALTDISTKSQADTAAITNGYLFKAFNDYGSGALYLKNVEQLSIRIWNDLNKNGTIDWGNEVTNFNWIPLQTPLLSWNIGEKGAPGIPAVNFFISGSKFTSPINAKELIDNFVAERKAYPVSPTDLPSTFTLTDIANSSASFGAWIMAGSGNHVISGTDYTDYVLIDTTGSNLINGGADVGYWKYNGYANNAMDRVRITEEVQFEGIPLSQSFLKITPGDTKAFAMNNTPNETSDDATANYSLKSTDTVFMYLLPLAGKIGFNGDIEAIKKALVAAKNVAEFNTALTNAKAISDVNFGVFLGLADINGDGKQESGSVAFLNAPATITNTTTEVTFTGNTSAVNKFTAESLLSSARFNSGKHHLINLADNKLWVWTSTTGEVSTAPQADMTAITTFATAKNVATTDYDFALVTYSEFDATKVVGVQLLKDIESLDFRLWLDLNKDNRQSGVEYSSSYLSYSILKDSAIYATEDLNSATVGGKQYAGISTGTSKNEIIDLKTSLQPQIRTAEQTKKLGINSYDYSGNDTITGTDFDDLFWLGNGVDSYDGGNGTDRIAFYWVPKEEATLYYSAKANNVFVLYQKTAANVVTDLLEITFDVTSTGSRSASGSIKQLNDVFADAAGASSAFAMGTADKFSNIEELAIFLDSSIKNTDGTFKYKTGNITDVKPGIIKLQPTAEYFTGTGADATKNNITFNGSPFADTLDAAALMATLPTSLVAKDDWRGSTLHTNIILNGGGDTVKGTANADLIDPGTGLNYIDGGSNIGRTAWLPSWIETNYNYWGAETPTDQVRFLINDPKEASGLVLTRLDDNSSGADATAYADKYTVKAVFTAADKSVSTNYLKNVEYVGLRLWTDTNKNTIRESTEVTSYSFTNIDKPVVNWRFVDINDLSYLPYYFNINGGSMVNIINAQSAIDDFIANKKAYPVTAADGITLDLPSNFQLSSVVNYSNARGAYIAAGMGNHYITGTAFNDTFAVSNVGNNWIDGGADDGYAKYFQVAIFDTDLSGNLLTNGAKRFSGTSTNDIINGTAGGDLIYGNDGNDKLYGLAGNDFLSGWNGSDYLSGGDGDDRLLGSEGDDQIYGGKGSDTAVFQADYSNYTVTVLYNSKNAVSGYKVVDKTGKDGTDIISTDVEFLEFNYGKTIVTLSNGTISARTSNIVPSETVKQNETSTSSSSAVTIRNALDFYRILQVVSESDLGLSTNIKSSNYKIIRLIDSFDLVNNVAASAALMTSINNTILDLRTTYQIANTLIPEFAVVKYDLSDPSKISGIDILRNIEDFDIRNWFDKDGNGRPNGSEVGSNAPFSPLLKSDIVLYEADDQSYDAIAGKTYAGLFNGTSYKDEINVQTELDKLIASKNVTTNKGMIIKDFGGDDIVLGTKFDDFFMTSNGNDTIKGGDGSQDRVGLYWKPSSTAGTPTIQVVKSTTDRTIIVSQKIGTAAATDLIKFTLFNTGADSTDPYWKAEHFNTGLTVGAGDAVSGTDKLYSIEQAVITVFPELLKTDGTPSISLLGLTNNALIIDLSL